MTLNPCFLSDWQQKQKMGVKIREEQILVAHPLHAVPVSDLQLLLGFLEAAVLLVVRRRLEVDVHIVGPGRRIEVDY